jgi:hypothetical protein
VSVGSRPSEREATELDRSLSLFGWTCPLFFSSVPFFFLDPLFLWAKQAGREIGRGRLGGIKPGVALVTMRRTGPFPFCMLSFIFLFLSFDSFPKQQKQERKEGA